MRVNAARSKLDAELNDAFMAGETRVRVLHGIGSGALKKMTEEAVRDCGFGKIAADIIYNNPGITVVDLFPPDRYTMRMYK